MDVPTRLWQRQGAWAIGRPEDAYRRFRFERRLFLRKMVFKRLDFSALGRTRLHQRGPFPWRLAGEIFELVAIAVLAKTTLDGYRENRAISKSSPFDLGLAREIVEVFSITAL